MTTDFSPKPASPLRVVSPATPKSQIPTLQPAPKQSEPTPDSAPAKSSSSTLSSYHRWLMLGGITVGLGLLSIIPLPHRVSGAVNVTATDDAYRLVSMPISGTVQKVLVSMDESVRSGDPVALIQSDELDSKIAEAEIQQQQSQATLEAKRQEANHKQAELQEANVRELAMQQRVSDLNQELAQMAQGTAPDVQTIQAEVTALQQEVGNLQSMLNQMQQVRPTSQLQAAVDDGAVSSSEYIQIQQNQLNLQNTLQQKQGQIQSRLAQIATLRQQKQSELLQLQGSLTELQAARESARQNLQNILTEIAAQERIVTFQTQELARQQAQRTANQTLHADITGTVVTSLEDLDHLQGRYVQAGETILEIVDLDELTAYVWIRQEDSELVKPGMTVQYRPQSGDWQNYTATVHKVSPRAEFSETHQKPMVRVTIQIENRDRALQPGTTGNARIEIGSMPIYQKISREVLKLVPIGKLI